MPVAAAAPIAEAVGGAAAAGGAAGAAGAAEGAAGSGVLSGAMKFGGRALMGNSMGKVAHDHPAATTAGVVHAMTGPTLSASANSAFQSVVQPRQFGG